jgi:hypothetical protein
MPTAISTITAIRFTIIAIPQVVIARRNVSDTYTKIQMDVWNL